MMDTLKWLHDTLGIRGFRILLVALSTGVLFLLMRALRILGSAEKEGRSIKLWGLEIGKRAAAAPNAPKAQSSGGPSIEILQRQKIVYAKVLHLRDRRTESPVYKRLLPDGRTVEIYDEVVFFVFHLYHNTQPFGKWSVRSSGIAYPQALYPWMDHLSYGDPKDPICGPVVPVNCNKASTVYIPLTHMFNGQQDGNRDVILRTECVVENARLVFDYSSVEGCRITDLRAYRGDKQIPGWEASKGVFTCEATNLEIGDFLRIGYSVESLSPNH